MAVLKREFHRNRKIHGEEYWFSLARDTETGEVYIIREFDYVVDGGAATRESVYHFLAGGGDRQAALLALIGTLVPD